ncbi:ADP-ribosylglycohydrolase family protein [Micrococcus porci]|uniref:ADP-ribosylglycohydrolase family protein n=1 Tax=Micrococcus porci TaxID=2856555 RepID=UPI003CF57A86
MTDAAPSPRTDVPYPSRVLGLLAAGAAGDALGYAVEFDSVDRILGRLGAAGVTDGPALAAVSGVSALPVSDDTQMTLYVLDGMLEWIEWQNAGQASDPAACVWLACLRWLRTQDGALPDGAPPAQDRWIDAHTELHAQRAPGMACLSGLRSSGMGVVPDPKNPDSKGCGAVMRSAPYGMVPGLEDHHVASFARQGAVLTHGHPTGWTAAAAFALTVSALFDGAELRGALEHARTWLDSTGEDGAETRPALDGALSEAARAVEAGDDVGAPGTLPATLGEGWVAEEALAIAAYAALVAETRAEDPAAALALALRIGANHGGDSDSTAALAGQLLGARHGMAVFGSRGQDADSVPAWITEREVVAEAARRWIAATT